MPSDIPFWVQEFKKRVKDLRKLAGDKDWFLDFQNSIKRLKETGQGNCIAWSKLMVEITTKSDLVTILVVIRDRNEEKSGEYRHQICVVVGKDNTVWYQSNLWLRKFKKNRAPLTEEGVRIVIKQIARIVGKECNYKTGTTVHSMIWQ